MTAAKPKPPREIVKRYRSVPIPLVVIHAGDDYVIESVRYVLADDATKPARKRKKGER